MKKYIFWIVVIAVLAFAIGGFSLLGQFIHAFAYSFYSMFVAIIPFLDLEQTLLCKLITILIVQALCGAGFFISHKTESKIGKIVSGAADAIATLLLFIA